MYVCFVSILEISCYGCTWIQLKPAQHLLFTKPQTRECWIKPCFSMTWIALICLLRFYLWLQFWMCALMRPCPHPLSRPHKVRVSPLNKLHSSWSTSVEIATLFIPGDFIYMPRSHLCFLQGMPFYSSEMNYLCTDWSRAVWRMRASSTSMSPASHRTTRRLIVLCECVLLIWGIKEYYAKEHNMIFLQSDENVLA